MVSTNLSLSWCSHRLSLCRVLTVTGDMALSPNIGSDRSWVYNVAADVSDGEATAETLAIRFANSESEFLSLALRSSRPQTKLT